ncbi:MAG: transposase [Sedimentisphaerales bacterium]|nr:transposase [Sedimentisphaerales bacterium]
MIKWKEDDPLARSISQDNCTPNLVYGLANEEGFDRMMAGTNNVPDPFMAHRFFPDARWSMVKLWQLLAKILIQTFCRHGIITLVLDDTLFHRSGRKVEGAAYWRDAIRSAKKNIVYTWGLNLVVLIMQIQPPWGGEHLGLTINMRLHRKNGPTLMELAMEMLNEVCQWMPKRQF